MPSEAKVLRAVGKLPPTTLIRSIVEYGASGVTDCPLAYMMHAGIQAALMGMDKRAHLHLGIEIKANTFTFLIGETGTRKTTAVSILEDLVGIVVDRMPHAGMDHALIIDAASREGLIKLLGKEGKRLVLIGEGGDWLDLTSKNNYQAPMRGIFLRAFDGNEIRHEVKDKKKSLPAVRKHCMSVIMAATPSHLSELTNRSEWEGGFMNRFMFVCAEQERNFRNPKPNKELQHAIAERVAERALWLQAEHAKEDDPKLPTWSPAAEEVWEAWTAKKEAAQADMPKGHREATRRCVVHALKLAMIASHDMGESHADEWLISKKAVNFATTVVNWSIADALTLYETIPGNPYERMSNNVLAVMEDEALKGYTRLGFGDIARAIKPRQTKRVVGEILDSLIAERKVFMLGPDDAKYFSLDEDDVDAPAEPDPDPGEEVDWSYKGSMDDIELL